MSDYPRSEPTVYRRAFTPDRVVAAFWILVSLYSALAYYSAFHARWLRVVAPAAPLFVWTPPLGSSLTSQISGLLHAMFVGAGIGFGRGWAFAFLLVTCLSLCAHTLLAHRWAFSLVFAGFLYLPVGLYCALRLKGTFGPPTGGLELRRAPDLGSRTSR